MRFSLSRIFHATALAILGCAILSLTSPPVHAAESAARSTWVQKEVLVEGQKDRATITVDVSDAEKSETALPVRVVVTASDGSHPDGSGNGVYSDGRFFADGHFRVAVPPGATQVRIGSGPNFVPLEISLAAKAGYEHRVQARLKQWFSPEERGWYGGDNHVHVKHDEQHKTRTSRAYTMLQGRANGLSYITEAGSSLLPAGAEEAKEDPRFLMRSVPEVRLGPFLGHRNTPGVTRLFPDSYFQDITRRPLPTLTLLDAVHKNGGVVIYTHPMIPPHLVHWMGATEAWSHAALGRMADAFDIDSRATELLWFALLNAGGRVAASGSTDAALERVQTPSPGDRRIYSKADQFTYEAIVEGIRAGRTFATNGGPVFPFLSAGTSIPGDTVEPGAPALSEIKIEVHTLNPLAKAELYWRGERVRVFPGERQAGKANFTADLREVATRDGWFVLRAEDEKGNWAVTSPIYVRPPVQPERPFAFSTVLAISNHTRFIELRREFFAHCVVTASEPITSVELVRDEQVIRSFKPEEGDHIEKEKLPVTGMWGEYAPGWVWHKDQDAAVHFLADWPVTESGDYLVRVRTKSGRVCSSDRIHFAREKPVSHALSAAKFHSGDTKLVLHGYGEEMPLSEIQLPFKDDHWWYPKNTFWRMEAQFGKRRDVFGSNADAPAASFFRTVD